MTPPAPLTFLLGRLGFDRPKLSYGLKVSVAAFVGLCICWMLGLEHPQWAAITVFVTAQPTRGQVIEKTVYRFIGTLIGAAFGAFVAWNFGGHLIIEMTALALWSALMVWIGSLQRAFRSYGTVLAGYSAFIVIVLNPFDPLMVREVALDRIITVFVGATLGIILAYLFAQSGQTAEIKSKARRLTADMLRLAGQAQAGAPDTQALARLSAVAAHLHNEIQTISSSGQSPSTGRIESLLPSLLNLVFAAFQTPADPKVGAQLQEIGARLEVRSDFSGMGRALRKCLVEVQNPVLEEAMTSVMASLSALGEDGAPLRLASSRRQRFSLDWTGAWQGALRIFLVLWLIGLAWVFTENAIFQYPLVSAAICMALATTGVTPARKMVDVIKGQVLAALVAMSTELVLWSILSAPKAQILAMIPAAVIFALIRSHRRTALSAPDYAITVMLLLSPSYTTYEMTWHPVFKGAMAALGGVLGYLAFLTLFPTDARGRRKSLWKMIKHDLQELSLMRRLSLSLEDWRIAFCARFLKIMLWADLEGGRYESPQLTLQKAFLTMRLAEVIFILKDLEHRADVPWALKRALTATLKRTSATTRDSESFARSFQLLEGRLRQADHVPEAQSVSALLDTLKAMRNARTIA